MTRGLIFSFLFHFLWMAAISFVPPIPAPVKHRQPVEVEFLSQKKSLEKNQSIVREAQIPEDFKALTTEEKLEFLSRQMQRVRKQVKAIDSGMTENRSPTAPTKSLQTKTKTQITKAAKDRELDPSLSSSSSALKKDSGLNFPQLPTGRSTLGESLPQVTEVGSFTALNADRYLFYSFFARIEELIRYPWESRVRAAMQSPAREILYRSLATNWITEIEVILDSQGHFIDARVLKESGLNLFDRAATLAFRQTQIFPNPPKELIEEDGNIHLRYGFNVQVRPNVLGRQ